jgi:hypothetical protein
MNTPPASTRAWAQQLLAVEVANRPAFDADGQAVVRVCEKLRISLTQFIGADGFTALLRRALALARVDVPSLGAAKVTAEGRLEGIKEFGSESKDAEAAITITAHLLGLLVTFVGETLTLRLMSKSFPDSSGPDSYGRTMEQSEDSNEQRAN